ncbi:MAG: glutamate--tRNA ligase family protein [bacterium]
MSAALALPARGAGRFAPTPTGRLHLGNARTALLAWLDARRAGLRTVLRVEDLDPSAIPPGCLEEQLADLAWLGLRFDEGPEEGGPVGPYRQSERADLYRGALAALNAQALLYPCWCSRREVHDAARAPHASDEGPVYARTCAPRQRRPIADLDALPVRRGGRRRCASTWRRRWAAAPSSSSMTPSPATSASRWWRPWATSIVLRRDGVAAYQLACAWDDAAMGCTRVLRGADLLPSTARQRLPLRVLGLPEPVWAHVGLVVDAQGQRLAKRDGAIALAGLREAGVAPEVVRRLLARLSGLPDTADLDLLTEAFRLPGPEAVALPTEWLLMRRLLQAFVDERVVLAVITFNLVVLLPARTRPCTPTMPRSSCWTMSAWSTSSAR